MYFKKKKKKDRELEGTQLGSHFQIADSAVKWSAAQKGPQNLHVSKRGHCKTLIASVSQSALPSVCCLSSLAIKCILKEET